MASTKRQAFTLVELLVVIAIIGMLMALLLPAVTQAIGSARRTQCENNQHQVAQALQLYETDKGRFPGFVNLLSTRQPGNQAVSWVVAILPELQRRDIYDTWIKNPSPPMPTPAPPPPFDVANALEMLVCPADAQATIGGPWSSYVVNCGQTGDVRPGLPATPRSDGLFFDRTLSNPLDMNMGYVASNDGTSTTIMLSENMGAHEWRSKEEHRAGFNWADNDTAPAPNAAGRVINRVLAGSLVIPNTAAASAAEAHLSSGHAGGVVATFVDGHSQFLSENVENNVYRMICTPNGAGCNPSQSGVLYPPLSETDLQR